MSFFKVIINPFHRSARHPVQPDDFIRRWGLGYELGQAVVYIASAAQEHRDDPGSSLNDLKRAEFYVFCTQLTEQVRSSWQQPPGPVSLEESCLFQKMRASPFPLMAEAVAREWKLSANLKEVIFSITLYKNFYTSFSSMRTVFLKQALKYLQREITDKEASLKEPSPFSPPF